MNTGKTILTHVAVFAMGLTLAIVARRPGSGGDEESMMSGRESPTRTSRLAGSGNEPSSATPRERREASSRAGKSAVPAFERLAEIVRIGDPLERQAALVNLIARLAPGEYLAVAEQYRTMSHYGDSRGEYEMILRGWAKADPMSALEYVSKQTKSQGQTSLVLSAWAGNDAAAAERWALDHYDGKGPNPWMAAVIGGIAAYDIAHASQLVEAMPNSHERGDAVESITRALLVQGADAAMAYPASIKDSQLRAGFVSEIAGRLAAKDPDKAAAWLSGIGDPESQSRASRRVAEALAKEDPATAANWLPTLKPEAQAEAARGIIPVMSSGDIAGTAQWVSSLAGMPNYDSVVEEFVWSCDYRAPEQSAAWIQGVSDPAQQTRLYHRMLGEWSKRDANAVKTWVANNEVPATVAKRFK